MAPRNRSYDRGSNREAGHLNTTNPLTFKTFTAGGAQLALTHAVSPADRHVTEPTLLEDGYVASVPLRSYDSRVRRDGKPFETFPFERGVLTFHDLRHRWSGEFEGGFDFLHLHIPRASLDEIGLLGGTVRNAGLPMRGESQDATALALASALGPAFLNPQRASSLFVGHVTHALHRHIVRSYLDFALPEEKHTGLSSAQERISKEMLASRLDGTVTLAEVAAECGMNVNRFMHAFKLSTGLPPYRWLMQRRIATARELLMGSELPLDAIAAACGFADQSHFTRVFSRMVGQSPGRWSREHGRLRPKAD